MFKLLIFFFLIIAFLVIFVLYALKRIAKTLFGFTQKQNMQDFGTNNQDREIQDYSKNEVLYRKGDVTILKGEAKEDK
jgi:hypothetical protein